MFVFIMCISIPPYHVVSDIFIGERIDFDIYAFKKDLSYKILTISMIIA